MKSSVERRQVFHLLGLLISACWSSTEHGFIRSVLLAWHGHHNSPTLRHQCFCPTTKLPCKFSQPSVSPMGPKVLNKGAATYGSRWVITTQRLSEPVSRCPASEPEPLRFLEARQGQMLEYQHLPLPDKQCLISLSPPPVILHESIHSLDFKWV